MDSGCDQLLHLRPGADWVRQSVRALWGICASLQCKVLRHAICVESDALRLKLNAPSGPA